MGKPSPSYKTMLKFLAVGAAAGLALTLLTIGGYHAAGSSSFCVSCHSMQDAGAGWRQSTHSRFACIDCHMPDSNLAVQLAYKAKVGARDVYSETLRTYPAVLRISDEGRAIASDNCLRCHSSSVENTFMAGQSATCLSCHTGLVHGSGDQTGGIRVQ